MDDEFDFTDDDECDVDAEMMRDDLDTHLMRESLLKDIGQGVLRGAEQLMMDRWSRERRH